MIGKYMNEKETDMYKKNGINELRKLKDANLYKERKSHQWNRNAFSNKKYLVILNKIILFIK